MPVRGLGRDGDKDMKDEDIIEPRREADRDGREGRDRREEGGDRGQRRPQPDRDGRDMDAVRAAAQQLADLRGRRRDASLDDADQGDVVESRPARRRRDASLDDSAVVELRPGDAAQTAPGAAGGRQTPAASASNAESSTPDTLGAPSAADAPGEEPDPFAEKPEPSMLKKYIGGMLSGSILTREEMRRSYKYLVVLVVMMLGYMTYTFDFQRLYRHEERLEEQVRELRAQAMTLSSMRMNATRESVIRDELSRRGSDVKESVAPPKVIEK